MVELKKAQSARAKREASAKMPKKNIKCLKATKFGTGWYHGEVEGILEVNLDFGKVFKQVSSQETTTPKHNKVDPQSTTTQPSIAPSNDVNLQSLKTKLKKV